MKNIAFIISEISLNSTCMSVYQYADYNETLLYNKSIIILKELDKLKNNLDFCQELYIKFINRFNVYYYITNEDIENIITNNNIEIAFLEKNIFEDNIFPINCKTIVHNNHSTIYKQGNLFLTVGQTINDLYFTNYQILPNIIEVVDTPEDLRKDLNIPNEAIVFGRYGAINKFNIPQVYIAIINILKKNENIYFLFMNTKNFYNHERIIYLDGTINELYKRKFINTCDAMIHGCFTGETFGMSVGEFSICKKPIITYDKSFLKEHLLILKENAITYSKIDELENILINFIKYNIKNSDYSKYTKEYVMQLFSNYINNI